MDNGTGLIYNPTPEELKELQALGAELIPKTVEPEDYEKLTPRQRQAIGAETARLRNYYAAHPKEKGKAEAACERQMRRENRERMRKHQPKAVDIEADGEFVSVEFTNDKGERVVGAYKLVGWDFPPSSWHAKERRRFDRFRAVDAAAGTPPPDQGKTPRS